MKKLKKNFLVLIIIATLSISLMIVAFATAWGTTLSFTRGGINYQAYNGVCVDSTGAWAINGCDSPGTSRPAGSFYCHVWLIDNQGRAFNYIENTNSYTTGAFCVWTVPRNVHGYFYYAHGYTQIYYNGSYGPLYWPVDSPWLYL